MVELKSVLFLIGFIIQITIQKRSNQEFLQAVIKEFQMKSPLLVSTNYNHDFTLVKNMAKTQIVKIVTKIPDKIVPSSNILLNNIDTKVEAAHSRGEAIVWILYYISDSQNYLMFPKTLTCNKKSSVSTYSFQMSTPPRKELKKSIESLIIKTSILVVMCNDKEFEEIYQLIDATIDKNIFIIKVSSKETFEVYSINGNQVIRKLGHFNEVHKFVWANEIDRDFINRRSNFLGLQLKSMTDGYANFLILDSRYKNDAPYFANNDTYLVNGYTSGVCYRLKYENRFSFSTMLALG